MNKRIAFLITARLKSTRLPKKLILEIDGKRLIDHVIDRIQEISAINKIIMCTSINPQDDTLEEISKERAIDCFRGNEEDVLQRLLDAAKKYQLDYIIGITGENPLFSIKHTQQIINRIYDANDHSDFIAPKGLPIGCATYAINVKALETVCAIKEVVDTEIWGYLINRPEIFNVNLFNVEEEFHWPELRITIDYKEDFKFVQEIFKNLNYSQRLDLSKVLQFLKENPNITAIHHEKIQLDLNENTKKEINDFFIHNKERILRLKDKIYNT